MKKRIIGVILTATLLLSLLPTAASAVASDVLIALGDYVELGTYNGEDILLRCVAFVKARRQGDGSFLID